ncbi:MAG: argininosuccinate lyase [Paracoccaceae bacterium]
MKRLIMAFATLGALAACGADGAPERPSSGVTGEARIGVVLR